VGRSLGEHGKSEPLAVGWHDDETTMWTPFACCPGGAQVTVAQARTGGDSRTDRPSSVVVVGATQGWNCKGEEMAQWCNEGWLSDFRMTLVCVLNNQKEDRQLAERSPLSEPRTGDTKLASGPAVRAETSQGILKQPVALPSRSIPHGMAVVWRQQHALHMGQAQGSS
jgi:hypothetical protein